MSESVTELRNRIDAADDRVVAALAARLELSRKMRELKRELKLPPVDPEREKAIFSRLLAKCDPRDRDTVYGVYEKIFAGSRGMVESIARGVCVMDGQALFCKSKGGKSLYLPGGHIDFGETAREALVREIREETGLEARAGDFLGVVESSFVQNGERHCEINLVYRFDFPNGKPPAQAREDWIEYEWVDLAKVEGSEVLPAEMKRFYR